MIIYLHTQVDPPQNFKFSLVHIKEAALSADCGQKVQILFVIRYIGSSDEMVK
jgi:hypothetical protein